MWLIGVTADAIVIALAEHVCEGRLQRRQSRCRFVASTTTFTRTSLVLTISTLIWLRRAP